MKKPGSILCLVFFRPCLEIPRYMANSTSGKKFPRLGKSIVYFTRTKNLLGGEQYGNRRVERLESA